MTERHVKTDIHQFLANTLPESRRREVESHAASCTSCRHALEKARAKQSRQRRQALKTAQPGSPNLFVNRLSKQGEADPKTSSHWWIWIFLFLLVGSGAYYASHHRTQWVHSWFAIPSLPTPPPLMPSRPVEANVEPPNVVTEAPPKTAPTDSPKRIRVADATASTRTVESPDDSSDQDTPQTPQFWSGSESGITDERQVTVKGVVQWRALWVEMGHNDPAPHINFNTTLVVGVFAGEKPSAGYTVLFKGVEEGVDSTLITYSVDAPPASSTVPQRLTHPYAMRTIERGTKPIRFVEESN